jgi:hypothetical protein
MTELDRFYDWDIMCSAYERAPAPLKAAVSSMLTEHDSHAFIYTVINKDKFITSITNHDTTVEYGYTTTTSSDEFIVPLLVTTVAFVRGMEGGSDFLAELIAGIVSSMKDEEYAKYMAKFEEITDGA